MAAVIGEPPVSIVNTGERLVQPILSTSSCFYMPPIAIDLRGTAL